MNPYTTVTDTLNTLKKEGYVLDFNLKSDCIECKTANMQLHPADFIIDKFFRFEGASDPADNAIVYAIETNDGTKGTVTDAYGPYADGQLTKFMDQVEDINKKTEKS